MFQEVSNLIRMPEVLRITGLNRNAVYRLMRDGFPQPVKIGARAAAWPESEVRSWIASRIAARNDKEAA